MIYETFELRIQPGRNDVYEALVTRSLAGDARAEFALPFDEDELAAVSRLIAAAGRYSSAAHEVALGPASLQEFGAALYRAAFGGDVAACLLRSLDEAKRRGAGLRIRLRIDERLPALADLPWEYLYAPELGRFLALADETPLLRYLEIPQAVRLAPARPPLVVLAVLSNPSGVTPLAVEREWEHLREAMAGLGGRRARLEQVAATWPALQARLRQGPAHVLHFIGHGYFDQTANQGGLVFEDDRGQAVLIAAEKFKVLLHDQSELRLVFLNACESARGGRSDSFAGVAQQLVQQAAPAVVAMQFPVSDQAAIVLSREFYRALAGGYPVEAAVSQARKAVFGLADSAEWGAPVLFSRADDNRLIELPQGDRREAIERLPFEPETLLIPGGPLRMGSDDPALPPAERPAHALHLPDFRIGKYPVTVRQYAAFVKDRKEHPAPPGWFNREPPAGLLDHPMVNVSWRDALVYCAWLSEQTGRCYTLPSEAEWEKAASGGLVDWEIGTLGAGDRGPGRQVDKETRGQGRQRRYPWGDEWRDGRCNATGSGTTAVAAHPDGASAYGVEDLLGNVQQWTRSLWGTQPGQPDFAYPYDPADGREVTDPAKLPAQARLVHRGGSFKSQPADLRCTARGNALPDSRIAWRGFRVALRIE